MLKFIREGQRWLTALFVVGVGFVFVFFLGLGGPMEGPRPGSIATVGPYNFGFREFERARRVREDELQNQLGAQYDARRFRDTLDDLAVRQLVDDALLAVAAQELGMRVSNREIEHRVENDSGFRNAEGNFDIEAFRNFVDYEYGGERAFLLAQHPGELALKMRRLLLSQPHVSQGEIEHALRRELEQVRLAFVTIDAMPSEALEIDPAAVTEALDGRASDIEARYDSQPQRFNSPEQVHARHILVRVPSESTDAEIEAASERAQDLLARIEAGEDFEVLAREHSEDTASRESGGDLGFFRRGQMVGEFEEAAFGTEPGDVAGPVRSAFGIHLIRVEDRQEAESRSLAEASEELAIELLREDAALNEARVVADAIARDIGEGKPLEEAASARDLEVSRTGLIQRRVDGYIPGLGASSEVLATAFSLEPESSSPRVFQVGNRLALIASLERLPADPDEVAARAEEARETLRVERINSRAATWLNAQRDALLDAGMLEVDLAAVRR